ncbi:hypothetical protein MASR2M17_17550 [Aminivibrio sp.]
MRGLRRLAYPRDHYHIQGREAELEKGLLQRLEYSEITASGAPGNIGSGKIETIGVHYLLPSFPERNSVSLFSTSSTEN